MSRPTIFASESFAEAVAAASAAGKLLILDATAAWCQPCKMMDRVTWADPKVNIWFAEHAIAVQIDVDERKELAASLGIRSMPTVIALRAGKELDRVVGMKGPADLLAWLEAVERGETAVDQVRRAVESKPDDMQGRYMLAKALESSRRLGEATEEYAWLWQHMLEHQPSMVGVRSSFMLNDITGLVRDYPPARERFGALRDALESEGTAPTASPREVSDWISLFGVRRRRRARDRPCRGPLRRSRAPRRHRRLNEE